MKETLDERKTQTVIDMWNKGLPVEIIAFELRREESEVDAIIENPNNYPQPCFGFVDK